MTIPRRAFVGLAGAVAAAWSFAVHAQQTKVRRVGALLLGIADAESFKTGLREGLLAAGYIDGQNIVLSDRRRGDSCR